MRNVTIRVVRCAGEERPSNQKQPAASASIPVPPHGLGHRREGAPVKIRAFDPKCVVRLGNSQELDDDDKMKSFELFRCQASGVSILTFDEAFDKIRRLVELLEGEGS